jgi:hypothetical protein
MDVKLGSLKAVGKSFGHCWLEPTRRWLDYAIFAGFLASHGWQKANQDRELRGDMVEFRRQIGMQEVEEG